MALIFCLSPSGASLPVSIDRKCATRRTGIGEGPKTPKAHWLLSVPDGGTCPNRSIPRQVSCPNARARKRFAENGGRRKRSLEIPRGGRRETPKRYTRCRVQLLAVLLPRIGSIVRREADDSSWIVGHPEGYISDDLTRIGGGGGTLEPDRRVLCVLQGNETWLSVLVMTAATVRKGE